MKCLKCGTENEGNICTKCGNHLYDNSNVENSIFFDNNDNNLTKTAEYKSSNKVIHDEGLKSIMSITQQIIADNKQERNQVIDNNVEEKQQENTLLEVPTKIEPTLFENKEILFDDKTIDEENKNLELEKNKEPQNDILLEVPEKKEQMLFEQDKIESIDNDIEDEIKSSEVNNNEDVKDDSLLEFSENIEEIKVNQIDMENINESEDLSQNNSVNVINNQDDINLQSNINQNLDDFYKRDQLDIFINKNSDNIVYKKYGIIQGLLGNIWLLYRKCYVSGSILGILDFIFILYVIFLTETPVFIYLILRFILYFIISKEMYIKHAKNKIKKIKNKNVNLSEEKLNLKIKKSGGTFIVAPIIFIVVVITLLVIGAMYIYKSGTYQFHDLNVQANGWVLNSNDGLAYIDDEKTCIADISYGVKNDENIMSSLYQKGIITEEQYVNKLDYNFDEMDKELINEKEWFKITVVNESNVYEDVLLINNNDVIYFINFKGSKTDDYALCQPKFIDFKNSLKFN